MPRCSECGKWGLFLKLNRGRCFSCHQEFMANLELFNKCIDCLKDSLPEIEKAKSIDTLLNKKVFCESMLGKIASINNRYRIAPEEDIQKVRKILVAIQKREAELKEQMNPPGENRYRRNWGVPLNEQFSTQDPSLSQSDAAIVDRNFCISFLSKVRNELSGHPELNKVRYPVPRSILSLRHPEAKSLVGMFDYFAFPNLNFLDDSEYMYVYLAHSQAGKKNDPNFKYGMNGYMQSFFPDHERAIKLLFDLGFFIAPDIHRTLHAMTIPQIRSILSSRNITAPSKARKNDLIDLVVSNFTKSELESYIQDNAVFELSDFGYGMVHSLYNDAGYSTSIQLSKPSPEEIYEKRKAEILSDLRDMRSGSAKYFVSSCALDKNTCPICGERDMVPTKISDASIGYNAPPYHNGCRCCVLVYNNDLGSLGRWARDPVTNQSYKTTAKNYSEWIQRIDRGER